MHFRRWIPVVSIIGHTHTQQTTPHSTKVNLKHCTVQAKTSRLSAEAKLRPSDLKSSIWNILMNFRRWIPVVSIIGHTHTAVTWTTHSKHA
jgi:hypothetical protein